MLLDAWRLAVGTLSALPVTPPRSVDRQRAGVAMVLAPLAVVPLGVAVAVLCVVGAWLGLPVAVTAILAIGASIGGNRGFHLDGLSDVADGLAASFDRERSLAVMKSGTSGPAGVVATVLVLGLQVAALASLLSSVEPWRAGMLAGVALCVARVALAACCARGVRAARADGLGRTYTQTVPRSVVALVWVLAAGVLGVVAGSAGLAWWRGVVAVVVAAVVVGVVIARALRRFGGVTGDVFGACVEMAFAAVLVALS